MKKNFYLFLVMLFAGVTSMFAQKVYIEDFEIAAGDMKTLDIILESEAFSGKAVQADFVLPEGLEAANTVKNEVVAFNVDAMIKASSIRATGAVALSLVSANVEEGAKVIGTLDVIASSDYQGGVITVNNQKIAGTKVEDLTVNAALAEVMVTPAFEEVALNSHSNVSVDSANSLNVRIENCPNVLGASFILNEMNQNEDEEGTFWTVGEELVAAEMSMSAVAYYEFEEMMIFEQGKKYQLTVTVYGGNPADPAEVGTYTYEFYGSYVAPIVVIPALINGEEEITLNDHSAVSVEAADAIKVDFENGAAIKQAMYTVCEAIEEDGELTYGDDIAFDVLSLSTVGYAEFEQTIQFEQGKQYWVRVMAWDNEDPTSTPVATYECLINGSYVAPLMVYPSLVGDDDVKLNNHGNVSVNMASSLKVEFENGANVIGVTYLINEMNMGQDEDGIFWTVGAELAAGEANLNTIAFAELDETLYFLQGKKYQLTVTAFENAADPTEIGTYTYEFNGSYVEPIVANIVISEAGYATYWAPFTVDLSKSQSNVEAYIITGINEDNTIAMQLIEDGVIPAFQPVLLKGDAGTIIPESGEEEEYTNPDGILEAVEEDSPATIGNYVLQIQNGVLGFYQVSEEVQPTVKAYHATLVAPGKGRVKAFYFGEATAISEMAATSNNANIYDLNGRKVAKAQNGVFVVNGKKVIK